MKHVYILFVASACLLVSHFTVSRRMHTESSEVLFSPMKVTDDNVLVCITFYTPWEDGGYEKSTGGRLTDGKSAAVDPKIIPYGSKIKLPGLGERLAEDTGSDVKSKRASRARALKLLRSNAINFDQYERLREVPVVDVFVSTKNEYERLCKITPEFLAVKIK